MEWAIWLTVVLTLLAFPPTRWLIKGLVFASLGVLALLLWSEPDLTE
jgi:hypothetical protein